MKRKQCRQDVSRHVAGKRECEHVPTCRHSKYGSTTTYEYGHASSDDGLDYDEVHTAPRHTLRDYLAPADHLKTSGRHDDSPQNE